MPNGRVLVVDDDEDIRMALGEALADEGYEIAEARDREAALAYLESHSPPRVILLDWNMAPMNATRFVAETAKHPVVSKIPVVLLTAGFRVKQSAKEGGFAEYPAKPVDLEALLAIVARYCA